MVASSSGHFYPIGVAGVAWADAERKAWRASAQHVVARSYNDEVLKRVESLRENFTVSQYGALSCDATRYPLMVVKSKAWDAALPSVLITGGVHGYETSGVQGALLFLESGAAAAYAGRFNFVVAPCVSPWGYEHIQRWNVNADDPNRGFKRVIDRTRDECVALMNMLESLGVSGTTASFISHIDLHETTDTDESEFRPARQSRDGQESTPEAIPDGFYLVGDSEEPALAWHTAIIEAVKKVTHIAPPEADGMLLGRALAVEGVVLTPKRELGLCAWVTGVAAGSTVAPFRTTTEVYPDSPSASGAICNAAQVAAITAALDFIYNIKA